MKAFDTPRERAQLLLAILGVAVALAVTPFATGLLGALVLNVAVSPVYRRLGAYVPRRAAALMVVVAATSLILLPVAWLIVIAIDQAPSAIRQLQDSAGLARLAVLHIGGIDVGARIVDAGGQLVSWASAQAIHAIGGVVRITLNLVVALFGLYFLLLSGEEVWRRVASYLPFSSTGVAILAERFRHITEATVLGTALTAVLQGCVVGLGFALTELPDAWFWGVVTAVVSVLPVFGSAFVWGPGAAALALQGRYGAAVAVAVIGAVLASNIDNVMRPLVNRRVSNVHPMTTVVGAFAGVAVLGLPGILLGPLTITCFFELVGLYEREYPGGRSSPTVLAPFVTDEATSPTPTPDRNVETAGCVGATA